jgi:3-deoxy-D-manno-octulosonate 8-phosphate phosphatase (KDO 8-P phosphatase)
VNADLKLRLANIGFVGFDVDGVFTDGDLYLSDDGSETKRFNTQDGYGVRRLLAAGVTVAVISGRRSKAVERRMAELGVEHVVLGSGDKVADFDRLIAMLGIGASDCAFVGDDMPDLALMKKVGVAIGVANSHPDIHADCDWITSKSGGRGAVREVADAILAAR